MFPTCTCGALLLPSEVADQWPILHLDDAFLWLPFANSPLKKKTNRFEKWRNFEALWPVFLLMPLRWLQDFSWMKVVVQWKWMEQGRNSVSSPLIPENACYERFCGENWQPGSKLLIFGCGPHPDQNLRSTKVRLTYHGGYIWLCGVCIVNKINMCNGHFKTESHLVTCVCVCVLCAYLASQKNTENVWYAALYTEKSNQFRFFCVGYHAA